MTNASAENSLALPPAPRWLAPWLALLAPLYIISPLALLGMPHLKKLPTDAKWILGFYALSQQLPALFTPEPLLASAGALLRTLLMFGLIGTGVAMGSLQRLKPFAIGLFIVYCTSLGYSHYTGLDIFSARLSHPYMTSITVGLAGAFGVWLAIFLQGRLLWRIPFGLLALAVLLLSGSRGPLLALIVGCVAALLFSLGRDSLKKLLPILLAGGLLIGGGVYVGERMGVNALARLTNIDSNGRDIVWYNTISIIKAYPVAGVGSYRLGKYLTPPGKECSTFENSTDEVVGCPAWLKSLGNPWLIAHNLVLQQLAETGPLGLLGFLMLLGIGILSFFQSEQKSKLAVAFIVGLLVSTISDNTLLFPSPFYGEIFWLQIGLTIAFKSKIKCSAYCTLAMPTYILLIILSVVISPIFYSKSMKNKFTVIALRKLSKNDVYIGYIQAYEMDRKTAESYNLYINSCIKFCINIKKMPITYKQLLEGIALDTNLNSIDKSTIEIHMCAKEPYKLPVCTYNSWEVIKNKQ